MEVFQLVVAFAGTSAATYRLWRTFGILVRQSWVDPSDHRRDIAQDTLERQLMLLMVHGVFVTIGIVSVLLPPPSRGDTDVDPEMLQSTLLRVGLVIGTVILTAQAFLEQRRQEERIGRGRTAHKAQEVVTTIGGKEVARGEMPVVPAIVIPERHVPTGDNGE